MVPNGSPAPLFETDDERVSFVVRLPTHPLAKQRTADATVEVTILLQVIHWDVPVPALQAAMGLRNAKNFRKAYLAPAMTADYLEMILPDTPHSTRHCYRLTHLSP
jgi:ATP-dependent DNA helicase RecG